MKKIDKKYKEELIENKITSWSLKTDQVNFYSFWNNLFSKEECQEIIKIAKSKGLSESKIRINPNKKYRNSQVCWLVPSDIEWVFRKVTDCILHLNENFFKFDISNINEGFQFTNYKSPSGKYKKHVDRAFNQAIRKLSVSIQLTNPEEYEGGELYLYENEEGVVMDKSQGTLIMFPSYILHEVTPVTKGERNSLVTWVSGKQFT